MAFLVISALGPPGSGKGTQAEKLAQKLKLRKITTGDLFRKEIKKDTPFGRKIAKVINKGSLAPPEWAIKLLRAALKEIPVGSRGIVIDGSPRTLKEARSLYNYFKRRKGKENFFVVFIKITQREAFARLTKRRICRACKRPLIYSKETARMKRCPICHGKLIFREDDDPQAIKIRFEEYKKKTLPAIKYYQKKGNLITINGEQTVLAVHKEIICKVKTKLKALG